MENFALIGKALAQYDINLYTAIKRSVTPMLKDPVHIAGIYQAILQTFPDIDDYTRKMLFISTVYDCYCPGSYLHTSIMKMPPGIREEIRKVANFNNPEMVNYFQSRSQAHMKFRNRAFGLKVNQIKAHFVKFSDKPEDWKDLTNNAACLTCIHPNQAEE